MTEEEFTKEIVRLSREMAMTILAFAKNGDINKDHKYYEVIECLVGMNMGLHMQLEKIKNVGNPDELKD